MTELSWLCDLLVNHKLSPTLKKHVAQRITEVENQRPYAPQPQSLPPAKVLHGAVQSPSTVALMEKHGLNNAPPEVLNPQPIVTSPIAQAAMQQRQMAITQAITEKTEPGRTSPRKW